MRRKTIDAQTKLTEVELSAIKVTAKGFLRLELDPELSKSIDQCGLLNPLTINDKYELLAGGRRYTALKSLGRKKVPVVVYRSPDGGDENRVLFEELVQIDENLIRKGLDDVSAEEQLVRRKKIYEALYPETRKGSAGALGKKLKSIKTANDNLSPAKNSFVMDVAERTGRSERTVERALSRGEKASSKVKKARQQHEIGASHVDELVKLTPEEQDQVLPVAKGKSVEEVRHLVARVKETGAGPVIDILGEPVHWDKLITAIQSSSKKLLSSLDRLLNEGVAVQTSLGSDIVLRFEELKKKIDAVIEFQKAHGWMPKADHAVEESIANH